VSGSAPALELDRVTKRFGDAVALDGATLRVRPGTVHAVLGENGAGKSTLMRVAFGLVRPDHGTVRLGGVARRFGSSADAIAAGVGMVHQHFSLVPAMTVAENVALGGRGPFSRRRSAALVRQVGEAVGLAVDPEARVGSLGVGAQQRVEIVKTLSRDARLLILDEPTAVLAPAEAADLLAWLRRFADGGRSVVLITHKLREALAVADDVTVLRRGRTVLAVPRDESTEAALASAMLGGPPQQQSAPEPGDEHHRGDAAPIVSPQPGARESRIDAGSGAGAVVLRARDVTLADAAGVVRVRGASLEVRGGEIVGIVGVEGSGQRELLRALAGRLAPLVGTVELPPEVGLVPEDRHRDALLLDFPLDANVALRGAGRRRGRMRWPGWRRATAALLAGFDVRAAGAGVTARTLSGGNQQKLVLGRELRDDVRAVVVENPSRGLDIRATAEVHRRLRAARDAGAAVVVYSGDLDEVLQLAGRVAVLHGGRLREMALDRDVVGRAMLGVE
jgi:simple sugar transport system ATP-binding protein